MNSSVLHQITMKHALDWKQLRDSYFQRIVPIDAYRYLSCGIHSLWFFFPVGKIICDSSMNARMQSCFSLAVEHSTKRRRFFFCLSLSLSLALFVFVYFVAMQKIFICVDLVFFHHWCDVREKIMYCQQKKKSIHYAFKQINPGAIDIC